MELLFESTELQTIDTVEVDALCLCLFEDERPLRGANAVVDWRLCAQLSEHLKQGRLQGRAGERCLLPTQKRFLFPRVFALGLGPQKAFGPEALKQSVLNIFSMMQQAQIRAFAMLIPGRSIGALGEEEAIDSVLSALSGPWDFDRIVIVDEPKAIRVLKAHYEKRRREKRRLEELQHGMA